MFIKPFKTKSNQKLKASDRKHLKEEFGKAFSMLTEQNLDSLFPKKEQVTVVKIETSNHEIVIVYVVEKLPIAFLHENILFPTVYLLWKHPNIVLTFTTYSAVTEKLIQGADLMLPGVVNLQNTCNTTNFNKYAAKLPACVNVVTNKAPIAVGITTQSCSDMLSSCMRGKCVIVYHHIGDKLCTLENLPQLRAPNLGSVCTLPKLDEFPALGEGPGKISTLPNYEQNSVTPWTEDMKQLEPEMDERNIEISNDVKVQQNIESVTEEMDNLLKHCLLAAVKYNKRIELPVLTSKFFKLYIIAACPANKVLDIKKSSYKKLSSFLDDMMKMGIVKVEEVKKGVDNITEINLEHPEVATFYLDAGNRPTVHADVKDNMQTPCIVEAFSVTAAVAQLFGEFGLGKGDAVIGSNIRSHTTDYVKKYNLHDTQNKSSVITNELLAKICAVSVHTTVTWQTLMDKICKSMTPCYKITHGDIVTIRKGKLKPITISVSQRSGNKKVTLIDNLDVYGISLDEFSKECQHGVAASTSVIHPPGANKSDQLLVQGNQVIFVYNLLADKYRIPKKYLAGLENAPKKKK